MKNINDFNQLTRDQLSSLYQKRGTAPKVASIFGIHEATVRKRLKYFKIPRHDYGTHRRGIAAHNRAVFEGRIFGNLKVIKYSHSKQNNGNSKRAIWECLCSCGTKCFVQTSSLNFGLTKSCGCLQKKVIEKGFAVGELSTAYFNRILKGAKSRGLRFNITPQEIWDLFVKQGKICYYSGLPIKLERPYKSSQTASLDRIDNTKGYVLENICWVHKDVNKMKHTFSESKFINICKLIANHTN